MTDVELLEKKLALVETCLRELAGAQPTKLGIEAVRALRTRRIRKMADGGDTL